MESARPPYGHVTVRLAQAWGMSAPIGNKLTTERPLISGRERHTAETSHRGEQELLRAGRSPASGRGLTMQVQQTDVMVRTGPQLVLLRSTQRPYDAAGRTEHQ